MKLGVSKILLTLAIIALIYGGAVFYNQQEKPAPIVTPPTEIITKIPPVTPTSTSPASIKSLVASLKPKLPVVEAPRTTATLLKGMRLTFSDDFNTFDRYLDRSGNITCENNGTGIWQTVYHFCSRTIFSNNEAEIYIDQNFLDYLNARSTTPSNSKNSFALHQGVLAIEAAPADAVITKGAGPWAKYTSGLITTQFSFAQKYGYFEMRAKLPKGRGLWPAFWLLPIDKSWPPEIDVLEAFGDATVKGEGGRTMIHYATHIEKKGQACGAWYNTGVDITEGFHTYGVDWQSSGITYYFDGKQYATCPANPLADQPFYMLINLAVGGVGSWPGMPDASTPWPAHFYIDYVRAYQ